MKVERIPELPRPAPAGPDGRRSGSPARDDAAALARAALEGEELRAVLEALPGEPGIPRIPLPPVNPDATGEGAMRLDQAAYVRLSLPPLPPNDPEALARTWQALVIERLAVQQDNGGPDIATLLALSRGIGAQPPGVPAPAASPELLRWAFPVWFRDGQPLALGLSQADEATYADPQDAAPRRGPRRPLVLWLEIDAGHWGRMVLQVHAMPPDNIDLTIGIEHPQTAPLVRNAVPDIAAQLAHAGLRLAHCRLLQGHSACRRLTAPPPPVARGMPRAEVLSLRLFRALVEVATVLLKRAQATD